MTKFSENRFNVWEAIAAVVAFCSLVYLVHYNTKTDLQNRIQTHSDLPGHPQLVVAIENVDDKIEALEKNIKEIIELNNKNITSQIDELKEDIEKMCDLQKEHYKNK